MGRGPVLKPESHEGVIVRCAVTVEAAVGKALVIHAYAGDAIAVKASWLKWSRCSAGHFDEQCRHDDPKPLATIPRLLRSHGSRQCEGAVRPNAGATLA